MAWKWVMSGGALKDMKKLPREVQERVVNKLDFWVGSRMPLEFAETLTNYELGSYRFRIGDYRAAFDVEGETIVILIVKHRRDSYKG